MRDDYVFISLITFMKFVPPKIVKWYVESATSSSSSSSSSLSSSISTSFSLLLSSSIMVVCDQCDNSSHYFCNFFFYFLFLSFLFTIRFIFICCIEYTNLAKKNWPFFLGIFLFSIFSTARR